MNEPDINVYQKDFPEAWQELVTYEDQLRWPEECRSCRWFALCRNGCRRNREPVTAVSTNKNYFCTAYRNFLDYAYPRLLEIYRLLQAGRR